MNEQRKGRIILFSAAIIFAAITIISVIFYIIDSRKTATLHTIIAPSFAKVLVNNKKFSANQDIRLEPGEYNITVQADGFQTREQQLVLHDQEITTLALYLNPNEGDAFTWYEIHGDEYAYYLSASNYLANQSANEYAAKYPVSAILPFTVVEVDPVTYDWVEYKVGGGKFDGCASDYCIKITDTTGGNREKALDKIREKGFNPDDYQILYEETPIKPLPTN